MASFGVVQSMENLFNFCLEITHSPVVVET